MEKRILGIILAIVGIFGLILTAVKIVNSSSGAKSIKEIFVYGILGAIFFFSGIGLIKRTNDKAT